jgi:hypothetical protein
MLSLKTISSENSLSLRRSPREGLAFVFVALLVGCSSGSGTTGAGGGGGAAGKTGSAGQGGGGAAGAIGTAGAGGAAGTIGTAGAGGAAGAAGGTAGTGAVAGSGGAAGAGAAGAAGSGAGAGGKAGSGGAAGSAGGGGSAAGGAGGAGGSAGAGGAGAVGVDAGTHETDAGCQGVALSGIGVPAGTVATASTFSDPEDAPAMAIDGDLTNEWDTGTYTGWITLTFPAPTMISAVRIHADALPATNEIFTLSTSSSVTPLGSATVFIDRAPGTLLPDIQIPPALYSDITLTVNAGASWVGVNEIWLLPAPACP